MNSIGSTSIIFREDIDQNIFTILGCLDMAVIFDLGETFVGFVKCIYYTNSYVTYALQYHKLWMRFLGFSEFPELDLMFETNYGRCELMLIS